MWGPVTDWDGDKKKQEKRFPNSNPKNIELGLGGGEDERAE